MMLAGLTAPETQPRLPLLETRRGRRRSPGETESAEIANRKGTLLQIALSQRFVESVRRRDTKQRTAASLTSAATVERRDTWSRIVPDQIFVKDVKRRDTRLLTAHSL